MIKLALVTLLLIGSSLQQKASFKCDTEPSIRMSAFYSSSFDRFTKYRCTFENIKSLDDVTKSQSSGISPATTARVSTIVFLNSSLSQLPDKMFASFESVKKIDASRLVLDDISSSAFFNLKFLDLVDLSNNNLRKLNPRTFASMQIKMLDLSMNLIEAIDDTTFTNAEIEKLNLASNKLKSIRFINSLKTFNVLELNNNAIETFNKIELKADGWISRAGIFGDPEYPKIYLQNNKLTKIDCSSTIKIESLTLENNPQLTEINLNQCAIDEIDVSNCSSLKKVAMNENLLGFTAKNVRSVNIELSDAKSLTTLVLPNTTISQNVFDSIMKMENLTYLDLSYVDIGPLNVSTFSKLKQLQFLYLKATNISNIQFGTFSHQHGVKVLDISDNKLGYFDMNMIFSMSSLLSLDLSSNDLASLENYESAHFTFTLLQKIDLSNNKWPCGYLMGLIKIFRVYKVALTRSNLEEDGNNVHGVSCIHVEGEVLIEPLSPGSNNFTQIREKVNELINEIARISQSKTRLETRLNKVESKIDYQAGSATASAALRSENSSQNIEVKNSALLESALVIVCLCCTVFMAMKIFAYVKRNFLGRKKHMRAASEHTLSMVVDDY